MSAALVWLRRDLRLHDNPALSAAAAYGRVIPVYIHAPAEEHPWVPGGAASWWLHRSLAAMIAALSQRSSTLIIRRGPTLAALRELLAETGATAVFWNRLYEPALLARDRIIESALQAAGIEIRSFNGALLWEPWVPQTAQGGPYKVFKPFWTAATKRLPAPPEGAPRLTSGPAVMPASVPLDALGLQPRVGWDEGLQAAWRPGERTAWERLEWFAQRVASDYADSRDRLDRDGVSRLSPHLHWGELSPRQVWYALVRRHDGDPFGDRSTEAFLRELGWREFAHHVLFHFPYTADQPMQERFQQYPWRSDYGDLLYAWRRGRTGVPLVDAGMRQLWGSGWLHNRARMIVASFLTKNLRIPWQEGARWFWDTLVDADLANNTLGWQWTAGCGVDAAPYFRIFNPVRQARQYDPEGRYIGRWIPELAGLPSRWRAQPWTAPGDVLTAAGIDLGRDYPRPLIDLARSREEALARYQTIKS